MSKSRGNVINPDDVVEKYGADSLRLYEMFMGPLEQVKPWSTKGVEGVNRFLNRVWRLYFGDRDHPGVQITDAEPTAERSEERRVGKESRSRGSEGHRKEKEDDRQDGVREDG